MLGFFPHRNGGKGPLPMTMGDGDEDYAPRPVETLAPKISLCISFCRQVEWNSSLSMKIIRTFGVLLIVLNSFIVHRCLFWCPYDGCDLFKI